MLVSSKMFIPLSAFLILFYFGAQEVFPVFCELAQKSVCNFLKLALIILFFSCVLRCKTLYGYLLCTFLQQPCLSLACTPFREPELKQHAPAAVLHSKSVHLRMGDKGSRPCIFPPLCCMFRALPISMAS